MKNQISYLKQLFSLKMYLLLFAIMMAAGCKSTKPEPANVNVPAPPTVVPEPDVKVPMPPVPKAKSVISETFATGAEQTDIYVDELQGKKVALTGNHTSLVDGKHLLDVLIEKNVDVVKIFSPEHGFRGKADAGAYVKAGKDSRTGLPVFSLYGSNKKPSPEQLSGVDVMIFDMQDVGVRFYTYISTMHYVMEACAEQNIPVIILDRPNPNGHYIDGPVLKPGFESFVGMHPIPLVHGLTIGELALMINGEGWLSGGKTCDLTVVPNKAYHHDMKYDLPVKPSPNLPNSQAVMLYPSLALFEGTNISVGRGTDFPFQVAGAPKTAYGTFTFTPKSKEGATSPMHKDKTCYGVDLRQIDVREKGFTVRWVLNFYNDTPKEARDDFFNTFFENLVGNADLRRQIKKGLTEEEIRAGWQADLQAYKEMRKKYLLYH